MDLIITFYAKIGMFLVASDIMAANVIMALWPLVVGLMIFEYFRLRKYNKPNSK